jgi:putative ABC transport system ATP-binding protein
MNRVSSLRGGGPTAGDVQRLESPHLADPGVSNGPVIELLGIGRTFGTDPPVIALNDVSLKVPHGDSVAIVGPSGSGKSTLLNVLGCLDTPSSGTYLFEGIDVGSLDDDERAVLRAQRIGFVFQTFHLLSHRTVLDNVMLAEVYRGDPREGREDRAKAALEKVGLGHRVGFKPNKLSGGEKQRVAVARALMGDPRILLCDEPTGNLDSTNTDSVLALFDELSEQGMTLLTITHEDHVAAHARRTVRITDGHLIEEQR